MGGEEGKVDFNAFGTDMDLILERLKEGHENPEPTKKRPWRLSNEITEDDVSLRLYKALVKLKIRRWKHLLKHTDSSIIISSFRCYGELAECLKFYKIYLPLSDIEKEMLEAFEEAGIPFDKDDLRYCLGYSTSLMRKNLMIKLIEWRMKGMPAKYKFQKLLEAKEIIDAALE